MKNNSTANSVADPNMLAIEFLVDYTWTTDYVELDVGNGCYTLRRWRGEFYIWRSGKYNKISDDTVRQNVTGFLQQYEINNQSKYRIKVSQNLVNNVILNIQPRIHIGETYEPNNFLDGVYRGRFLGFANGLLNMDTLELIPHTPNFFNISCLPYDHNKDASYGEWEDFLLDVMDYDAESVMLLQQWAGYLLTPNLRQQKFLLIAGDGANGKGVFFEIIELMLGRENVSHLPLAAFGDRFALAPTLGKLANMSSESSADLTAFGENVLKSYTAGDAMTFDRKYREPVECVPTAKVMIATNDLPRIEDKTQGIWRRMIFVPFNKTFSESQQDKHLAEKLSANMSGVFKWALKGIDLLKEYNGFITPEKSRQALAEYQLRMNPARGFLKENYEFDFQAEGLLCNDVYKEYEDWCEQNGFKPFNSSNFGREVFRVYPQVAKIKKSYENGRFRVYQGLKRVQSVPPVPPNP